MANDRMALVCPCGGYFGLAKHFGAEWEARAYHDGKIDLSAMGEQLDAFLHEHHWCIQGSEGKHFRIQYESEPLP